MQKKKKNLYFFSHFSTVTSPSISELNWEIFSDFKRLMWSDLAHPDNPGLSPHIKVLYLINIYKDPLF